MNNDLISISEAKKLGATCLARRNENGQLEAIISLDNAPTVETSKIEHKAYNEGFKDGVEQGIKLSHLQGKWIVLFAENNIKTCKCSICGRIEDIADFDKYPFCHCGAQMYELKTS